MKQNWWFRFSFLLLLVVLAVAALVPSLTKLDEDSSYPFQSKLNLGLDLQGGLYMVLGIDFNKVYRDEVKGMGQRLTSLLEDGGIAAERGPLDTSDPEDPKQSLVMGQASQVSAAKEKIREYGRNAIRFTRERGGTRLNTAWWPPTSTPSPNRRWASPSRSSATESTSLG